MRAASTAWQCLVSYHNWVSCPTTICAAHRQEHVDEGVVEVGGGAGGPLHDNQDAQVAKQAVHEDHLRGTGITECAG